MTATEPRRRRPPVRTWRWRAVYRLTPGARKLTEQPAFTREDAESLARIALARSATEVAVVHVDHGGWRTDYPIRPVEEEATP